MAKFGSVFIFKESQGKKLQSHPVQCSKRHIWKDLIQQNRKINLQEVFSYPLGPIRWVLAEANGEHKKSRKAKIMHELEKGVTRVEQIDASVVPIFDGMALVRMVKYTGLTYNQLTMIC